MKIIKFIVNTILSFLLMNTLICIVGLKILNENALKKEYILAKIDETGFYNQLSKEINDGFENYVYQSGLPEDTIQGLFTEEVLRNDIDSIVSYVYGEREYHTSEDLIRANIDAKINSYLEGNNIQMNDRGKANIDNYESLVSKEYKKKILVSENAIETAKTAITTCKKVNSKVRGYPYVVSLVVIVLLIIVNRKNLLYAINYAGISFLSAGAIFRVGIELVNKSIKFDSLMIYSKSTTNLFVNIAKEIIHVVEDYSNFFVVCGAVAILITAILNGVEKKRGQETDGTEDVSNVGKVMQNFGTSVESDVQRVDFGGNVYDSAMPPKQRYRKPKRRKNRY